MENATDHSPQVSVHQVGIGHKLTLFRDGVHLGDWLETEVVELFKQRLLLPTDYCRRAGAKEWQRLEQIIRIEPRRRLSVFRPE